MIVDKLFIQQLRRADCVSLIYQDGYLTIRTSQRQAGKYYNETDFEYSKRFETLDYSMPSCRFFSSYIDISGWEALAKLVRIGDRLVFHAYNNGSQSTKDAGIFVDQLAVRIERKGKLYINQLTLEQEFSTDQNYRAISGEEKTYALVG